MSRISRFLHAVSDIDRRDPLFALVLGFWLGVLMLIVGLLGMVLTCSRVSASGTLYEHIGPNAQCIKWKEWEYNSATEQMTFRCDEWKP